MNDQRIPKKKEKRYMNNIDHTLLVMGVMFITYMIGNKIGTLKGMTIGFEDGAAQAVSAVLDSLQKQYGMSFKGEIVIDKRESDE